MNQSIEVRDLVLQDIKEVTLILQEISAYYSKEGFEDEIWQEFLS